MNTCRLFASIFSISLCSLLVTKNVLNNETSLCVSLPWNCTNSSREQWKDTNLEISYAFAIFAGKIGRTPRLKSSLNVNDAWFWLARKDLCGIVDWLYVHMWKQLYAILIGCIGFFHMWKYSIYLDFYKWGLRNEILVLLVINTLTNLQVRVWSGKNKLLMTIRTVIHPVQDPASSLIPIDSTDKETEETFQVCDVHSVQKIEKYFKCKYCNKKILQGTCTDVIQCERCGFIMRATTCEKSAPKETFQKRFINIYLHSTYHSNKQI